MFHTLLIAGACAAWLSATTLGSIVIARRVKFQQKYSPIPALTYALIGATLTIGALTL